MTENSEQHIYHLSDIETILKNGFEYQLPEETYKMIQSISEKVGAPSYSKTPNFRKRDFNRSLHGKKKKSKSFEISETDWESIRNFKTTEKKKKDGADEHIDKIRRSLNKMTDESYDTTLGDVLQILEDVINEEEVEQDKENGEKEGGEENNILLKISTTIFDIASQNKFYSALYADLYNELTKRFGIMRDIFMRSYSSFVETFDQIEYVDPEKDYDKFCVVNRENDKRKAMSLFITHLMKREMVSVESVIGLVKQLQTKFSKKIAAADCENVVEEICENLFIILTNGSDSMENHAEWDGIMDYVKEIGDSDAENHPSLTNKVIFKHMDIVEEVY